MGDFMIGLIIVATCIGVLNGAVYGWLFFGLVVMMASLWDYIVTPRKNNDDQ